ncbi:MULTISPECIES: ribulokinase [unclassified Streptomyces]|uniref:ribulokinase n=1 Tax=unclassified Streptomyces TaxID=2593676 RepID=UPI002E2BA6D5|nr:ribulokinase [Streptomyces sp. NBC_01423]WSX89816.1 ribulokinase [Streptomyces sp. NBC_00891]WSY04296.1 ribulokinase [Streptomyces sp. NBC_00890]WSZ05921.1 ribulokinase [Streptomyces sp. NBC_00869]WSZ26583.1 ribulokinase [Streptomyces sp. NBC_00870]
MTPHASSDSVDPHHPEACTVGVDFGTLSGRAVVVRVRDGAELGSAVHDYRHAVIEDRLPLAGVPLPPDWALQHPEDWRDVLRTAVPAAVAAAGVDPARVIGIATDFTACTVLPTTTEGLPLALLPEWSDRPHAWPKLWKHHAAQEQADRINALAHERGEKWISRYGGRISSEWQFAKALQVLEEDPEVYAACARWIEAADWIVWQLTGAESRNTCTAGYKGIHQDGAYPSPGYLGRLHPDFADFPATRLEHPLSALGSRVGGLSGRAAAWTGLPEGIAVAAGNVDAHVAAPAAGAVENGRLLAIMGTSTCHVLNGATLADVPGICGVVEGGIVEGAYGYEAGQSAVGDIFAWWLRQGVPDDYRTEARDAGEDLHQLLTRKATGRPVGAHGLVALDWMNGNRSTLVDHHLSGVIAGLTLDTRPEDVYLALLESTAYGTRVIVEAFEAGGIPVEEFIVTGGLRKNALLMQIYADVLRRPVSLGTSEQGPALGSAIHAAVAAGAHPDVRTAAARMGSVQRHAYTPDPGRADAYDALFAEYRALHDHFGTGTDLLLHRLRRIRNAARTATAG